MYTLYLVMGHSVDLCLSLHEEQSNLVIIPGLKKNPKHPLTCCNDFTEYLFMLPLAELKFYISHCLHSKDGVTQPEQLQGSSISTIWGSMAFHPSLCMLAPVLCNTVLSYLFPFICFWFQLWIGFDGWQEFNNEEDWTIGQEWSWANSLFP